ncbi:glycerophosphodiester phosphodiesterase family protein [Arthrobacter sp. MMS18-M83]|uniref:glycerophosphodiester phosphodiesterase family protein n=1 Tax=Arthrobacter sp. MMS18-M83 TaxID=2996261 RepID=UPI00227D522E|nr:glycerophosphodiester phosphodiesterase family protein [Arthrobacter sp. MMS18-M83]WAH95633.1 glycerophosphodiester phosphodiesterase family protein [Arthrobacter sp. MMS18-M83]
MFGQPRFVEQNAQLNAAFERARPLVAVHRGTGLGTIAENTQAAVEAALRQGAEMVEIDIVESTDGEFFLFHDGYEPMHFGIQENIRTLDAASIRALEYRWCSTASNEPCRVTTLGEVLGQNPCALFNVDRSWWYWERLLPYLDRYDVLGRAVLKSPVDREPLELLAAHPVKYPFAPMVRSHEDVLRVLEYTEINTVGMELLAEGPDHDFASPDYVEWLHSRGLFVLLNAINLSNGVPLFCGWDDEMSVLGDPDSGWGRLVGLGADIIQTDWPGLLVPYRNAVVQGASAGMLASQ